MTGSHLDEPPIKLVEVDYPYASTPTAGSIMSVNDGFQAHLGRSTRNSSYIVCLTTDILDPLICNNWLFDLTENARTRITGFDRESLWLSERKEAE